MAEIGIHLRHIVVTVGQSPFESRDICRSEAQFPLAFDEEQAVGKLAFHQPLHDRSSAVGAPIVYDKDVKTLFQAENGTYDLLYILLFIVGRNDD